MWFDDDYHSSGVDRLACRCRWHRCRSAMRISVPDRNWAFRYNHDFNGATQAGEVLSADAAEPAPVVGCDGVCRAGSVAAEPDRADWRS